MVEKRFEGWQGRVMVEKQVIDERRVKLLSFFNTDEFKALDPLERERLARQIHHMNQYSAVLGERIEAFGGDPGSGNG